MIERNLRLYGWCKVFAMRVYLPLTTIYLVEVGRLTLAQIGFIGTVSALTTVAATIPAGYFADRVTRRASMIIGTLCLTASTLMYALWPAFPGAVAATILAYVGYSFLSGAGEALIHDTLDVLDRTDDYIRVIGRAQSFGLVGNIILVGLVPLTYSLDKRLPFLIGSLASLLFTAVCLRMVEPTGRLRSPRHHHNPAIDLYRSLRQIIGRHTVVLFMGIGLTSGLYLAMANFNNLIFQDLGLAPSLLGLMFAAASCLAVVGGWYLHLVRRWPIELYAALDIVMACGFLFAIGLSRSLLVGIVAFLIQMSFWRFRKIVYQDLLLRRFSDGSNKATLISTLGFFENVNAAWLPFVFVGATASLGFYRGYTATGAGALIVLTGCFVAGFILVRRAVAPTKPLMPTAKL